MPKNSERCTPPPRYSAARRDAANFMDGTLRPFSSKQNFMDGTVRALGGAPFRHGRDALVLPRGEKLHRVVRIERQSLKESLPT